MTTLCFNGAPRARISRANPGSWTSLGFLGFPRAKRTTSRTISPCTPCSSHAPGYAVEVDQFSKREGSSPSRSGRSLQTSRGGCRGLAVRGESPSAFDERCILVACVAPPSNTGGILGRRALPARRLARLGAAPDFHHGLLGPRVVALIIVRMIGALTGAVVQE